MSHYDKGEAESPRQFPNQGIKASRSNRVKAGGRFVKKKEARVHDNSAGNAGALLHAAAEIRRKLRRGGFQADEAQLGESDQILGELRQVRKLIQRQPDVLDRRERAKQSAALVQDAEFSQDAQSFVAFSADDAGAGNQHVTSHRLIEPNKVFKQCALAGTGYAEDGEHFATTHLEVDPFENKAVAVANRKIAHFNQAAGSSVHFLNV